jgi:hypothetical protein
MASREKENQEEINKKKELQKKKDHSKVAKTIRCDLKKGEEDRKTIVSPNRNTMMS